MNNLKRNCGIAWGIITVTTTGLLLMGAGAATEGTTSIVEHEEAVAQSFEASGIPLPTVSPDSYTVTLPEGEPIVTDDAGLVQEYVEEYGATSVPAVTPAPASTPTPAPAPAPTPTSTPTHVPSDEELDVISESDVNDDTQLPITLVPCPTEDSDNCYWDASVRGNGTGTSFISLHGTVYYPEG